MPGILAIQIKRIGDAVLTAAALASLRARHPDARIVLMLSEACGDMGALFPMVDVVLTWRSRRLNLRLLGTIGKGGWDAVLDFSGTDRSAMLALLSRAPLRAGYGRFATNKLRLKAWTSLCKASVRDLPTVDFHHELVRTLWPDAPTVPDAGHLKLPEGLSIPRLPQGYVLLHPGTARAEKYWPADHWAALLKMLGAKAVPAVMTGGTGAEELAHLAAIRAAGGVFADLSGKLTLQQLAGVIAGAAGSVTVDTGAMHLASAFKVPQVALFGPTNPWHWAPRHETALILHGSTWCRGIPGTETSLVPNHRTLLPKAPREEMGNISPEAVMAALAGVMKKAGRIL